MANSSISMVHSVRYAIVCCTPTCTMSDGSGAKWGRCDPAKGGLLVMHIAHSMIILPGCNC